jgi:hypothetical protein
MDRLHGIPPGDEWRQSLEKGVTNAKGLLACLSRNYVNSSWCRRELQRADVLKKPIFPVLLGPVPDDVWPMEIQDKQYVDFQNWNNEAAYQAGLKSLLAGIQKQFNLLQPGQAITMPEVGQADPGRDDLEDVADRNMARTVTLQAQGGFKAVEAEELRKRMDMCIKRYQAAAQQLRETLSRADVVVLESQMEGFKADWEELAKRLRAIEG